MAYVLVPALLVLMGVVAYSLIRGIVAFLKTTKIDLETGEGEVARWEAPRIDTPHSHGTGCTLASAIATGLAQGMPLEPAIARARDFVRLALMGAPGLGAGHGPMRQQFVRNDGLFTGPALNQLTLPASDYPASVAFYKQMGLTLIVDSPDNGYARFEAANGVTLSIHVGDGAAGGATTYLESGALDAWRPARSTQALDGN